MVLTNIHKRMVHRRIKEVLQQELKDYTGTITTEGFFMALSQFLQKMDGPSVCKQARPFGYFIQRVQVLRITFGGRGEGKENSNIGFKSRATASRQQRVKCKHYPGWLIPTKGLLVKSISNSV